MKKGSLKILFILSLALLFLASCGSSEASEVLEDRIFKKHIGDGANSLAFLDGDLLVSEGELLPPEIEEPKDYEEPEQLHYENVELIDGADGEFTVEYEGEELYRFHINEEDLLEEEDGTTYVSNDIKEDSE